LENRIFSKRYWFRDWPNRVIPAVAAGVYVVWRGDDLIYAGMSGKDIEKKQQKRKYGLVTRLSSHASGRLSGDQMNVYVANRFVVPEIDAAQQAQFAAGTLRLDTLTRQYIHEHLEYQYLVVERSAEAYALERLCRCGHIFEQRPYLNPDKAAPTAADLSILDAILRESHQ
jgi:hypothetical protein